MHRALGFIFLLIASIGSYFAISSVRWQHYANHFFIAVPAHLVGEPYLAPHTGRRGSVLYSPEASYSYDFQRAHFTSSTVLALDFNPSTRDWAAGILSQINRVSGPESGPDGVVAYVNPQNPAQAILVRDYSFAPYALGMVALIIVVFGLGMLTGILQSGRQRMSAIALDESGWQLLLPRLEQRKQLRSAIFCLIGGSVAITVMPLHWSLVAGQGGVAGLVGWAIAVVLIAALAVLVYRGWSVCHHISDARLRVRPAPARHGQLLALNVDLDARAPLRITRWE